MEKLNELRRLTAKQAQLYIPCSRATLTRLMKKPGFPVIRVGRKIIVPRDELDAWLSANIGKRV